MNSNLTSTVILDHEEMMYIVCVCVVVIQCDLDPVMNSNLTSIVILDHEEMMYIVCDEGFMTDTDPPLEGYVTECMFNTSVSLIHLCERKDFLL